MKYRIIICFLIFSSNTGYSQIDNASNLATGNEFEYIDCGCSGSIDLEIYNGLYGIYGGQVVPDADETAIGAVTVANKNNTDGDSNSSGEIIDNIDNNVIMGTGLGQRDEVDLMKMIITYTGTFPSTCTNVDLIITGNAKIWANSTKGTQITNSIPINSLPLTVWVEAFSESNNVRDITIEAKINNISQDIVKATAVWAKFVKKYNVSSLNPADNPSALTLGIDDLPMKPFLDNLTNVSGKKYGFDEKFKFNSAFPNGSCVMPPYTNYLNKNSGIGAHTLFAFEVFPHDLVNEPNLLGVKFDIVRQINSDESIIDVNSYTYGEDPNNPDKFYMGGNEGCNDNPIALQNDDEDLTPTSLSNFRIFSTDAPGYFFSGFWAPSEPYAHRMFTAKEFVRVSFGNLTMGEMILGSRCSDYVPWKTTYTMVSKAMPGVTDPFEVCNHIRSISNINPSISAITRENGTSIPIVNIAILPMAINSIYKFRYISSSNEWELYAVNSINPLFTLINTAVYNAATNNWILSDNNRIEITISNGTFNNNDFFSFHVLTNGSTTNFLN